MPPYSLKTLTLCAAMSLPLISLPMAKAHATKMTPPMPITAPQTSADPFAQVPIKSQTDMLIFVRDSDAQCAGAFGPRPCLEIEFENGEEGRIFNIIGYDPATMPRGWIHVRRKTFDTSEPQRIPMDISTVQYYFMGIAETGTDTIHHASELSKRLTQTPWNLTYPHDIGQSLHFMPNGDYIGHTGCNPMSGTYQLSGDHISLQNARTTLRACFDNERMQAEQIFTTRLKAVQKVKFHEEALWLIDDQDHIILAASPADQPVQMPEPEIDNNPAHTGLPALLSAGEWAPAGDNPHGQFLILSETGQLSGFDGCNSVSGSYSLEDSRLIVGQLASTRKFCPGPERLEVVKSFSSLLQSHPYIHVLMDRQILLDPMTGKEPTMFVRR